MATVTEWYAINRNIPGSLILARRARLVRLVDLPVLFLRQRQASGQLRRFDINNGCLILETALIAYFYRKVAKLCARI